MEVLIWKRRNCCVVLALAVLSCVSFRGVTCQEKEATRDPHTVTAAAAAKVGAAYVRGDDVPPTPRQKIQGTHKPQEQVYVFPSLSESTPIESTEFPQDESTQTSTSNTTAGHQNVEGTQAQPAITTNKGDVRCVDEATVRGKQAVRLKLKASSSCEENKIKIQSVQEHLCRELDIFQQENTDEMIISGPCIQADGKGMRDKFNNDNIKDKVDIEEAELIFVKHSRAVLVSVLLTGLLLAALLIAGYLLTTHRRRAKGLRLAEDSFQVDEQNQGNTLLSVAPLPSQEPFDKPTSNGESPESPPTNGHSTVQTPVADTQM